jgi:hypothetical protein
LISSAFAGQVHAAAAGRVEFAVGGASVTGPGGQRPITRGAEVNSGDVVRTTDGRVQVRMADGAYISLQPNTEFGIKDYRFAGKADGTESAFYSLLKGAMRTVTGLIGRTNRDRYQVATPTATVGIRGTGGLIQILDDGATLVQGTSGIWFLANPAGSIDVPAGVSGISPSDPGQPPKETEAPPTAGPAPLPPQEEYVQGNQANPDGTAVIAGNVLVTGDGYTAMQAYSADTCGDFCIFPFLKTPTGVATFNGSGQMTQMDASSRASAVYTLLPGGTHAEFGTDAIVAWGRWIGPVSVPETLSGNENYNANQGFHYVVGLPTAAMPQSGSATYSMIGATSPTEINGFIAPGTFSGSMQVADWSRGVITMTFDVNMPSASLGYRIDGSATISANTFSASFVGGPGITGTVGSSCSSGCSAGVNGFFAGTAAARAGVAYHINDSSIDIIGAAAFAKQ